tara:strand:+ start:173 stop:400 length:228 start_codon:yes stop_codon:yes gene_type:complete
MNIFKGDAINSLGNWSYKMIEEDTNQITFYDNEGNEISKPADFPNNADINARQADMQTKADTGDYKSVQAIIATY